MVLSGEFYIVVFAVFGYLVSLRVFELNKLVHIAFLFPKLLKCKNRNILTAIANNNLFIAMATIQILPA